MRTGKIYKHRYNTDVAMEPITMHTIAHDGVVKVKCLWYNITNPKATHLIDHRPDYVEIKVEDIGNWEMYEQQD